MNNQPTAYQTFGTRLGGTVHQSAGALQSLWDTLAGVQQGDQASIQRAIQQFQASVGTFLPSYQKPTDPWDLGSLPGATGTAHEGGLAWNPNEWMQRLYERIGDLRGSPGSPPPGTPPGPGATTPPPQVATSTPVSVNNVSGGMQMPSTPGPSPVVSGKDMPFPFGGMEEDRADIGASTRKRLMGV